MVRRDPFAMLPFMGLQHERLLPALAEPGRQDRAQGAQLPRIYTTNWFRKNAEGKFVWPGYGENMRVLKWMIDRIEGRPRAGNRLSALPPVRRDQLGGLDFSAEQFQNVTQHRQGRLDRRLKLHDEHFAMLAQARRESC